jgi:hypothetical protein
LTDTQRIQQSSDPNLDTMNTGQFLLDLGAKPEAVAAFQAAQNGGSVRISAERKMMKVDIRSVIIASILSFGVGTYIASDNQTAHASPAVTTVSAEGNA